MKFKLSLLILVLSLISCNEQKHIENVSYVTDVEVVEYLTFNYCVDKNSKSKSVTIVPEKSTYKNQEIINKILLQNKYIESKDGKMNGNCYDYTYRFINKKYENKIVSETDCKKYAQFKTGNFKYVSVLYPNTLITRTDSIQIEKSGDSEFVCTISWQSPCEYSLTYINVSKKKYDFFIGKTTKVQIIDMLPNGDYVYKANFLDQTFVIGIMKKL
ncbi:MAG: hypothetical protein K8R54_03940 [Bacteroidales bacterium]|nr:hypothetical protein [Bacteroidales bacterium]